MKISSIYFNLLLAILVAGIFSCKKTSEPEPETPIVTTSTHASCEGCHTDYAYLQKVYSPDTVEVAGGCGGEAPYYEPYDRVYMGGEGFSEYKNSTHYTVGCVGCHNGVGNTDDKKTAHSGSFISHPSMYYEEKCGNCHQQIVNNFKTSIHNGTGQKRKVAMRSGLTGPDDFDQLPQHQIEGYNKNCSICHGTCGNCHIVRPSAGGGGLSKGHSFTKTPDMLNICVTCHVSRGGHAYLGVASGTKPDVHLTDQGYKCLDCHNGAELHGDGVKVDQRYAYSKLPKCVNCHTGIASNNIYHSKHFNSFNCQVCHSQDYNNCGQCHINSTHKSGPGAQIPSYLGFKIAGNPLPTVKAGFDFTLVRRTLAAPENWDTYLTNAYPSFDVLPTYNYTSPHNILRWTSRTQVDAGKSCSYNCHIRNESGTLVNKELYLFKDDLLNWEMNATSPICVDDKLPSSWTN